MNCRPGRCRLSLIHCLLRRQAPCKRFGVVPCMTHLCQDRIATVTPRWKLRGFPGSAGISSRMPRPVDSGGPPHPSPKRVLLCCLRCTLKPSASATSFTKLYQHFRERDLPYGLRDSLSTLSPSCSPCLAAVLRHGPKTRYGWVASPYPTGTSTPQDAPSFARRDNALLTGKLGA